QGAYRVDRDTLNDSGLSSVPRRNQQVWDFAVASQHRNGQDAFDRPQFAAERKFPDHQVIRNILFRQQPKSPEDSDGNRKVECRTLLFDVSGSEVDNDFLIRSTVSIVANSREHTVLRFSNRGIRKADNDRLAVTSGRQVDFDIDEIRFDS